MSVVSGAHIEFARQWAVYEPGDTVSGTLHLSLRDRLYADTIALQLCGSARVFWIERQLVPMALPSDDEHMLIDDAAPCEGDGEGDRTNNNNAATSGSSAEGSPRPGKQRQRQRQPAASQMRNVPYSAERIYFDTRIVVYSRPNDVQHGHDAVSRAARAARGGYRLNQAKMAAAAAGTDNGRRPQLAAGAHTFAFSYELPDDLPTSFDSTEAPGTIRYFVKAHVSEWQQNKFTYKELFTVVRPFNLNAWPPAAESCLRRGNRPTGAVHCLRPKRGCVDALLMMHKVGYVPGERLAVAIDLRNESARPIKSAVLKLVQRVRCHALMADSHRYSSRLTTKALVTVQCIDRGDSVLPIPADTETPVRRLEPTLLVPAITPTFSEADLIEVDYIVELRVSTKKNGRGDAIVLTAPVTIGTIPLSRSTPPPAIDQCDGDSGTAGAGALGRQRCASPPPAYEPQGGPPAAADAQPPSYEESVAGAHSYVHSNDTPVRYLPRYPVYNF